jgi:organic radical activating enzyme
MTQTFCPLPWIHLGTHPHGGVTPCCISDHTAGLNRARNFSENGDQFLNLNDHSINDHMNSDYFKQVRQEMLRGKEPAACKRCYQEERKGIESKRQHEAKNYSQINWDYANRNTRPDGGIHLDLRFVELRLGNVCNVRCRTCNPASSSRWVQDYKKVVESLDFVNDGYSWLDHKHDFQWPEDDAFYEDLYNCAPHMEVLYINGGEPTLIKAHWNYLKKLVESGRSKQIVLWYNINMTNLPDYAVDIWKEFKEARICPSIDDLDERNKYIRYPTEWKDVVSNLSQVLRPSLTTRITQTVSAYNYMYLDKFFDWAPCPVDMNFVYDPDYLSPEVIPVEVRRAIHTTFKTTITDNDKLNTLLSMFDNDTWDPVKWEHFCRYNDELDKIRGHDKGWREVFPELITLCEQYDIQHRF